ncbi:MAG: glycerophosphoryl diester phosphodiesterase membrane domain-containing protein, partial [Candidatus Promineifilaceae bacterium]
IPGFFMLGVMFLFSYVAMPLMVPVLVLEGVGAWEAIKRAWNLARRRVWPLFGLMLVIALFVIALISGIQVVILTIFGVVVSDTFASGDFDAVFLSAAVAAVGFSALASVFVLPIQQSIATLIYLDLRMRNEGLDLAMAVVAPDSDPLEVIRNAPRQANSADLVESAEFGRFLGLGCAPVIFFFALYALTFGIVVALVGLIGTF